MATSERCKTVGALVGELVMQHASAKTSQFEWT